MSRWRDRLSAEALPDVIDVVDFGIRGVHLAYELASGAYGGAVLIDAVPGGGAPGTLYVIEPDTSAVDEVDGADAHSLTPAAVLAWLHRIGGFTGRLLIVGCEPESVEESMGLSAPVAAAVEEGTRMVRELAIALSADGRGPSPTCRLTSGHVSTQSEVNLKSI